jgi:hypothetical protein
MPVYACLLSLPARAQAHSSGSWWLSLRLWLQPLGFPRFHTRHWPVVTASHLMASASPDLADALLSICLSVCLPFAHCRVHTGRNKETCEPVRSRGLRPCVLTRAVDFLSSGFAS